MTERYDKHLGVPNAELDRPEVPEREIVAVRQVTVRGHQHIELVKFADGQTMSAADLVAAIHRHDAHFVMRRPDEPLPRLVDVRPCPDCGEPMPYA